MADSRKLRDFFFLLSVSSCLRVFVSSCLRVRVVVSSYRRAVMSCRVVVVTRTAKGSFHIQRFPSRCSLATGSCYLFCACLFCSSFRNAPRTDHAKSVRHRQEPPVFYWAGATQRAEPLYAFLCVLGTFLPSAERLDQPFIFGEKKRRANRPVQWPSRAAAAHPSLAAARRTPFSVLLCRNTSARLSHRSGIRGIPRTRLSLSPLASRPPAPRELDHDTLANSLTFAAAAPFDSALLHSTSYFPCSLCHRHRIASPHPSYHAFAGVLDPMPSHAPLSSRDGRIRSSSVQQGGEPFYYSNEGTFACLFFSFLFSSSSFSFFSPLRPLLLAFHFCARPC